MRRLERDWYRGAAWLSLLAPLEWLYRAVVSRRRREFQSGRRATWCAGVPVVVVGNVTLGGTGKSPLVARLAGDLAAAGWRPGIVSRGYGGKAERYPLSVTPDTPVAASGDEPLMLAQQTGVPVAVDPDRSRAARLLVEQCDCNIVISDDGLQHHALGRTLELVVIDGARGLGNRRCLPRGPLREPAERLERVDALIGNGGFAALDDGEAAGVPRFAMQVVARRWRHLKTGVTHSIDAPPFGTGAVDAVAGIGHPQRFFDTLEALGVEHRPHAFGDHHRFTSDDLPRRATTIVMTAKDGVKCREIADERCWVLDVEAELDTAFERWWYERIARLAHPTATQPS